MAEELLDIAGVRPAAAQAKAAMLFSAGAPTVMDPAGVVIGDVDLRTMTEGELTYLDRGVPVSTWHIG